jgi:hypothetical protein
MTIIFAYEAARHLPFGGLTLVVSNGQPMHPFSFMATPLGTIAGVLMILFFFACFKTRRLFPVQIAIIGLTFGCIEAFMYSGGGPTAVLGRGGIARAEISQDLARLADAQRHSSRVRKSFTGKRKHCSRIASLWLREDTRSRYGSWKRASGAAACS